MNDLEVEEEPSTHKAILRRKTDETWTDKHRNVMRKLVVEGGWVQKRLCDIGWSEKRNVEVVTKKRLPRSTDYTSAGLGMRSEVRSQRNKEMGAESQNIKEGMEVAKRQSRFSVEEM